MRLRLVMCGLLGFLYGALPGCVSYVGRGSELYYQGHYIEAAHLLEMSEGQLRDHDEEDRALYGLYRGATLYRLGDLDGARRWLEYSEHLTAARPAMLRDEQQALLQETTVALRADLGRRATATGSDAPSRITRERR